MKLPEPALESSEYDRQLSARVLILKELDPPFVVFVSYVCLFALIAIYAIETRQGFGLLDSSVNEDLVVWFWGIATISASYVIGSFLHKYFRINKVIGAERRHSIRLEESVVEAASIHWPAENAEVNDFINQLPKAGDKIFYDLRDEAFSEAIGVPVPAKEVEESRILLDYFTLNVCCKFLLSIEPNSSPVHISLRPHAKMANIFRVEKAITYDRHVVVEFHSNLVNDRLFMNSRVDILKCTNKDREHLAAAMLTTYGHRRSELLRCVTGQGFSFNLDGKFLDLSPNYGIIGERVAVELLRTNGYTHVHPDAWFTYQFSTKSQLEITHNTRIRNETENNIELALNEWLKVYNVG